MVMVIIRYGSNHNSNHHSCIHPQSSSTVTISSSYHHSNRCMLIIIIGRWIGRWIWIDMGICSMVMDSHCNIYSHQHNMLIVMEIDRMYINRMYINRMYIDRSMSSMHHINNIHSGTPTTITIMVVVTIVGI